MDRLDVIEKINAAAAAYKQNNLAFAQDIIQSVLASHPLCENAWEWACELSKTPAEKQYCLKKILAINPGNLAAQLFLVKLQNDTMHAEPIPPIAPSPIQQNQVEISKRKTRIFGSRIFNIIFYPIGIILNLPPVVILVAIFLSFLIFSVLYSQTNLLGLGAPDFGSYNISKTFETIQSNDQTWKIYYEKEGDSSFTGLIRHTTPIRMDNTPILTHDILVTAGDFADPKLVNTYVTDHHFFWQAKTNTYPQGTINLLHTVPADISIFQQLNRVLNGSQVTIIGREILRIETLDKNGKLIISWQDSGCNTLLVKSITFNLPDDAKSR